MSKENKDRLEDFFKKNTENFHFEYNEADWKKLEARLEEMERGGVMPGPEANGRANGIRYYLFAALMILSGVTIYFGWNYIEKTYYTEKENIASEESGISESSVKLDKDSNSGVSLRSDTFPAEQDNLNAQEDISIRNEEGFDNSRTNDKDENREVDSFDKSKAPASASTHFSEEGGQQTASIDKNVSPSKSGGEIANNDLAPSKTSKIIAKDDESKDKEEAYTSGKTIGATRYTGSEGKDAGANLSDNDSPGLPSREAEKDGESGYQENQYQDLTASPATGALKNDELKYAIPKGIYPGEIHPELVQIEGRGYFAQPLDREEDIIDKEKRDKGTRRLVSVGFIVAPDFSTVGIGDYTRPGTRYGLSVDYHISRRFVFHTGVVKTDNVYTASGDEYNAPEGYWVDGVKPVSADGECKLLDIPVNMRFNILQSEKNQVFVSAGVSSYIMLKEKYEFKYEKNGYGYNGYTGTTTNDYWESSEVTKHWFGLVNFSVGYERFVADNWSVQAEPFFNVPVTGIGWGKVDLYSLGAYFSLKYHWNKR